MDKDKQPDYDVVRILKEFPEKIRYFNGLDRPHAEILFNCVSILSILEAEQVQKVTRLEAELQEARKENAIMLLSDLQGEKLSEHRIMQLVESIKMEDGYIAPYDCKKLLRSLFLRSGEQGGGWISVKDKPLLLPDEGDTWEITKEGTMPFLAFIPIEKSGMPYDFIAWCYIPEGTIDLHYVGDEDETGWMATDVTHYITKRFHSPPTVGEEKEEGKG